MPWYNKLDFKSHFKNTVFSLQEDYDMWDSKQIVLEVFNSTQQLQGKYLNFPLFGLQV